MRRRLIAALSLALSPAALADVIYDNITANSWHSSIFSEDEFADDTTLASGAGSAIGQVEIGVLRNPALAGPYSGTMTVRLWADAGGTPGALLGSASVPIVLTDNVPHIIAAAFPGTIATTATIWTGIQFTFVTQLGAGIVEGTVAPSVGSSSGLRARHYPDNTWGISSVGASNQFTRISTVPAPSALALLGLGTLVAARRRRLTPSAA